MNSTDIVSHAFHGAEADLPPKLRYGGYIYAVSFADGSVKVGSTANPRKRIKTHRDNAAAFGIVADRYWVSQAHDNHRSNERALIAAMAEASTGRRKAEYFTGVSIEAAANIANCLEFDSIDYDEHEKDAEHRVAAMRDALGIPETTPLPDRPDWLAPIGTMFGEVAGDGNAHVFPIVKFTTVPLSLIRQLAAATGRPVSDYVAMDYPALIEMLITMRAQAAASMLRSWARDTGRTDLTDPMVVEVSA